MRRLLADVKPSTFEEVVAILALFRPGPLDSGMTAQFVRRKNGQEPIDYLHPALQPVLKETYGVMVYQEQVIEAARVLAGFTLGQADLLRRAIGKKIPEEMAEQRDKFIEGCRARGIDSDKAEEIFEKIDYFSGYGFNKSHSAAYGMIAYQTAYLKANHPVEFMAALLSSDMDNTDKVVNFIAECRDVGVEVLPPDVNKSGRDFTIDGGAVRFGLNAVKNVGANALEVILAARAEEPEGRFADLAAFVRSVDFHRVNKRVLEGLVKCGGFDSLEPDRARLLAGLDELVALGLHLRNEQAEEQSDLFALLSEEESAKVALRVELPEADPLPPRQRLKLEKEALGFYLSGHPLDPYRPELDKLAVSSGRLREREFADGAKVTVAGVVAHLRVTLTRKSEKMAICRLEDLRGSIEVVVFSRTFAEAGDLLKSDEPLRISGSVRVSEEGISVEGRQVEPLARFREDSAAGLTLFLRESLPDDQMRRVVGVLSKYPGRCRVRFEVLSANGCRVLIESGLSIAPAEALVEELEKLPWTAPPRFEYPDSTKPASAPGAPPAPFAPPPDPALEEAAG